MRHENLDIHLRLFGPPRLEVGGDEVAIDTRKALALVAYLAVAGQAQPRDVLVDLLWPDLPAERGRATLRRTLSALRAVLGGRWVSADRSVVRLETAEGSADITEFRELVGRAADHTRSHAGDSCAECLSLLEAASRRAAAPFLQGFTLRDAPGFEDWVMATASSVDRERVRALDLLIVARSAAGNLDGAVDAATARLEIDPLSEETHRRLIELHAALGDPGAAVRQYRECVAILERELGVGPLPETIDAYEAVLRGSEPARGAFTTRDEPSIAEGPFVGRAAELGRIGAVIESALSGARLLTIEGEAGVGKTRAAREALARARNGGSEVISVECQEGEQEIALGVVTAIVDACMQVIPMSRVEPHALRSASLLLPWLSEDRSTLVDDEVGAQIRLYEAIRTIIITALEGSRPGVLFIDNAQWLDAASVDVLGYFVRRLGPEPLVVVVAWRTEDVAAGDPIADLVRFAADRVLLDRMSDAEVELLLRTLVPGDALDDGDAVSRVRASSEGLPLFVVEYAAAVARGSVEELPSNVRALVRAKLERLPETGRQLLGAAAIIGRDFDLDELTYVSGRNEVEAADAVDSLVAQHVLATRPGAPPTFGFAHDKVRELTLDELGPARRQLLHRRVAEALQTRAGRAGRNHAPAALIAHHLERGGRAGDAAQFHARAAQEARQKLAHDDAVRHLESALALGHPRTSELNEALGDVHRLRGAYGAALQHYEAAAAVVADAGAIARLEHKLGDVYARRGDWSLARAHLTRAVEELTDELRRALVLADLAVVMHRLGDEGGAAHAATSAMAAAEDTSDDRALAQAANVLGMIAHASGDAAGALEHLRESLERARSLGDHAAAIAALNNLALVHRDRGDVDAALERTGEALALSAEVADRHREAALHNNMADLLHELGDREASLEHLRAATALFAQIGYDDSGPLPEVWKLVSW